MSGSRKAPSINSDQSQFLEEEAIQLVAIFNKGLSTISVFDKSRFVNWFSAVPNEQKPVILTEYTKIHLKDIIETASREKNKPLKTFLQNYTAMVAGLGGSLITGETFPTGFTRIEPDTDFKAKFTRVFADKYLVTPPEPAFNGLERENAFIVQPGGSLEDAVFAASDSVGGSPRSLLSNKPAEEGHDDHFVSLERKSGEFADSQGTSPEHLKIALAFGAGLPGDTQPASPRSHSSPDAGEVEFKLQ